MHTIFFKKKNCQVPDIIYTMLKTDNTSQMYITMLDSVEHCSTVWLDDFQNDFTVANEVHSNVVLVCYFV